MRKFLFLGVVAVLAVGAFLLITTFNGSGSDVAQGAAAVVINDQGCGLLDGDGNFVSADSDHTVLTQSNNGNAVLKCSVKGVANSTGKAVHYDFESTGIPCGILGGGVTENWEETVSASGNATLTCLIP